MVCGGVAISRERRDEIEAAIQNIKTDAVIVSEMKWSKYRGGARAKAHKAIVDLFFDLISAKKIHFHVLIAHFAKFDHKYNDGDDHNTSANRMLFQLLLHRVCRFYGRKCLVHVYPDKGNDSADLPGLREVLCAMAYNAYGTIPNCVRSIEPQHSHDHNILQMVDIVIGGIAAKLNARATTDHKIELADYILEKAGHADWKQDTLLAARFMTVWNFVGAPRSPRRR